MAYYTTIASTSATNATWHWSGTSITQPIQYVPVMMPITGSQLQQSPQPPRAFNRYVNASDLLEEFIGFLGQHRVKQDEVLQMPLDLFVKWLIIRACEEDNEQPNVQLRLPGAGRCRGCGRFAKRGALPFHAERCAMLYFAREQQKQSVGNGKKERVG